MKWPALTKAITRLGLFMWAIPAISRNRLYGLVLTGCGQ
jgi:hypothetical protein